MTDKEQIRIKGRESRKLLLSDDLSSPWDASDEDTGDENTASTDSDQDWLDEALEEIEQESVTDPDATDSEPTDRGRGTVILCGVECQSCGESNVGLQHSSCEAPVVYLNETWQCGKCGVRIALPESCTECGERVDQRRIEVPLDLSLTTQASAIEKAVHEETNNQRADHGLNKLSYSHHLSAIANQHSRDMAERGFFSHTNPDGEETADRYRRFDHTGRSSGENIARTYPSLTATPRDAAKAVVADWMDSPRHRENILRGRFEREGIGIYLGSDGAMYATQNFY